MLAALAKGETDPARIAALAESSVRATQEQLCDAVGVAATLSALHRQILQLFLERLALLETQMDILGASAGEALQPYEDSVRRLAGVPGFGADSAQQIIADHWRSRMHTLSLDKLTSTAIDRVNGPHAATFPSAGQMASWVGCCPGREESAEVSKSDRSPKGNRHMRRLLSQAANAAVKAKGSVFQSLYRRLVPRMGHLKAIWAVAHRLCRIAWKILHEGVQYEERGQQPAPRAARKRTNRLIRELRRLGYQVQHTPAFTGVAS